MKKTKLIAAIAATAIAGTAAIGGTLAWFTAQTGPVTNTFTVGNITMTLDETSVNSPDEKTTSNVYSNVMPGDKLVKDPTVHIAKGSEKCWVYVDVKSTIPESLKDGVEYAIDGNWVAVDSSNAPGLYRYNAVVDAGAQIEDLPVFTTKKTEDNKSYNVEIKGDAVSEGNINDLNNVNITIEAFAHQSENTDQGTADIAAKKHFGYTKGE